MIAFLGILISFDLATATEAFPSIQSCSRHDLEMGRIKMTWSGALSLDSTDLVVVIVAPITAIAKAADRTKNANRTFIFRAPFLPRIALLYIMRPNANSNAKPWYRHVGQA
jgi:hypothetical protein